MIVAAVIDFVSTYRVWFAVPLVFAFMVWLGADHGGYKREADKAVKRALETDHGPGPEPKKYPDWLQAEIDARSENDDVHADGRH